MTKNKMKKNRAKMKFVTIIVKVLFLFMNRFDWFAWFSSKYFCFLFSSKSKWLSTWIFHSVSNRFKKKVDNCRDEKTTDNILCMIHRALGLPTSDLTYDDCKLMIRARQMNLPYFDDIVEIEKLRQHIGYVCFGPHLFKTVHAT